MHTPCLYRQFAGREVGDLPVVVLDDTGHILHRKGNGRVVQAEEQDRVHRPGGGGDQVLDADRRHAQILDLRDVAAPEARQDPEEQGSDPDFPPKLHSFNVAIIYKDSKFLRQSPCSSCTWPGIPGASPRAWPCVHEQAGGVAQLDVDQVVRQGASRTELEEPAEGRRTHSHHVGEVREVDHLRVVFVDILLHLQDAAAFRTLRRVGEGGAGQHTGLLGRCQLIEQQQKLQELPKAVLLRRKRVYQMVHLHDAGHREGQAVLRLLQHPPDGGELVLRQLLRREHVPRELDRNFPDILGLAVSLLPHVFQIVASHEHKVVVPDCLHAVPHDAAHPGATLDEVQFELLVLVHRIGEFGLVPLYDVEEVLLGQRGDFVQYVAHVAKIRKNDYLCHCMDSTSHISWFVVITRWGQWKKISERLTALGIRHFIPSSYNTLVFFRTDKERALNLVNAGEVKGRFIVDHSTRSILEVPEKQMDAFIKVVTEYPDTPVTSEFPITKGTRVRVVRGPLKGIEGEVEETPNGVQLIVAIQSVICARITIGRGDVVVI